MVFVPKPNQTQCCHAIKHHYFFSPVSLSQTHQSWTAANQSSAYVGNPSTLLENHPGVDLMMLVQILTECKAVIKANSGERHFVVYTMNLYELFHSFDVFSFVL